MIPSKEKMKIKIAQAALKFVEDDMIVGIGTGSTANCFIDALAKIKHRIEGVVSSSAISSARLHAHGFRIFDPNVVNNIPVYVDGADEINSALQMIKGGGGALAGEKVIASISDKFICIAGQEKKVAVLGEFPVAVEVLPMARSSVAREIVKLKGSPVYREGFITDNGNLILDVHNLTILDPIKLEETIKNITGVVESGIFAKRPADILLLATDKGIVQF